MGPIIFYDGVIPNGSKIGCEKVVEVTRNLRSILETVIKNHYNGYVKLNGDQLSIVNVLSPRMIQNESGILEYDLNPLPNKLRIMFEGASGTLGDIVINDIGEDFHITAEFYDMWPSSDPAVRHAIAFAVHECYRTLAENIRKNH